MSRLASLRHALLCLVGFLALLVLFNDTPALVLGDHVVVLVLDVFMVLVLVELLVTLAPLAGAWRSSRMVQVVFSLVALILGAMVLQQVGLLMGRDLVRARSLRSGWSGLADGGVLAEYTRMNTYYPDERFLDMARALIPSGDAVLYAGSMRGDPINYALYPRRVHMIPELQRATLDLLGLHWKPVDDPMFEEGFASYLHDPQIDSEELRARILALVKEEGIDWLVTWDVVDPTSGTIRRLQRP